MKTKAKAKTNILTDEYLKGIVYEDIFISSINPEYEEAKYYLCHKCACDTILRIYRFCPKCGRAINWIERITDKEDKDEACN